jgi:hypothetical protein
VYRRDTGRVRVGVRKGGIMLMLCTYEYQYQTDRLYMNCTIDYCRVSINQSINSLNVVASALFYGGSIVTSPWGGGLSWVESMEMGWSSGEDRLKSKREAFFYPFQYA